MDEKDKAYYRRRAEDHKAIALKHVVRAEEGTTAARRPVAKILSSMGDAKDVLKMFLGEHTTPEWVAFEKRCRDAVATLRAQHKAKT